MYNFEFGFGVGIPRGIKNSPLGIGAGMGIVKYFGDRERGYQPRLALPRPVLFPSLLLCCLGSPPSPSSTPSAISPLRRSISPPTPVMRATASGGRRVSLFHSLSLQ